MSEVMRFLKGSDGSRIILPLTIAYFLIGLIEIIAESNADVPLIKLTKPLLMPLLILIYWYSSKKKDLLFVLVLLSVWCANIFLISKTNSFIVAGAICILINRILTLYAVVKIIKFPGYMPMLIGSLPFLFLYLYIVNLTYYELGEGFTLFVLQGIFLILFGGFCLGNYIMKSNLPNTFLLISTLLFTAAQFLLLMKLLYESYAIFQPVSILFFVIGQYLLCRFVLFEERRKRRLSK